jgi:hypothetical protein
LYTSCVLGLSFSTFLNDMTLLIIIIIIIKKKKFLELQICGSTFLKIGLSKISSKKLIFKENQNDVFFSLILINLSGLLSGRRISSRGDPLSFHFAELKQEGKGSSSMSFGRDAHFHPSLCENLLQSFLCVR